MVNGFINLCRKGVALKQNVYVRCETRLGRNRHRYSPWQLRPGNDFSFFRIEECVDAAVTIRPI
jgi:hypothetical protein